MLLISVLEIYVFRNLISCSFSRWTLSCANLLMKEWRYTKFFWTNTWLTFLLVKHKSIEPSVNWTPKSPKTMPNRSTWVCLIISAISQLSWPFSEHSYVKNSAYPFLHPQRPKKGQNQQKGGKFQKSAGYPIFSNYWWYQIHCKKRVATISQKSTADEPDYQTFYF